ncbi:MAG: yniC [Candidatus Peribacteria bacterium]|nr:yniC [Candidatus Peribacteria bacterium]
MKAFIFDFDGVVLDTQQYWDMGTVELYRSFIPSWTEEDNALLRGRSVVDIYHILADDYDIHISEQEYRKKTDTFALNIYRTKAQIIDGVLPLLDLLDARHVPHAIASSSQKNWIEEALVRFQLTDRFASVSTADEAGRGKPYPDVYLLAAKKLGVDPHECVALEDTATGVRSAKAAGMTCIGFDPNPDSPIHLHADVVIGSLHEVTDGLLETVIAKNSKS